MKDKKLRKLSNYWLKIGDFDVAEEFAKEIFDIDLRNMQLERIQRYTEDMQVMSQDDDDDDDIIPAPNYRKNIMTNYCLGKVIPFSCEQKVDQNTEEEASNHITKNDTVLVMVECVSQFRTRYVVEVDADYPEYALDDVSSERCKEFSNVNLGEVVVSHRVVGVDEVLKICDEDNAYVNTWSDEKKLKEFVTDSSYNGGKQ